jgi:hypothetical protein
LLGMTGRRERSTCCWLRMGWVGRRKAWGMVRGQLYLSGGEAGRYAGWCWPAAAAGWPLQVSERQVGLGHSGRCKAGSCLGRSLPVNLARLVLYCLNGGGALSIRLFFSSHPTTWTWWTDGSPRVERRCELLCNAVVCSSGPWHDTQCALIARWPPCPYRTPPRYVTPAGKRPPQVQGHPPQPMGRLTQIARRNPMLHSFHPSIHQPRRVLRRALHPIGSNLTSLYE